MGPRLTFHAYALAVFPLVSGHGISFPHTRVSRDLAHLLDGVVEDSDAVFLLLDLALCILEFVHEVGKERLFLLITLR